MGINLNEIATGFVSFQSRQNRIVTSENELTENKTELLFHFGCFLLLLLLWFVNLKAHFNGLYDCVFVCVVNCI